MRIPHPYGWGTLARLDNALREQQLNNVLRQFAEQFTSIDDAVTRLQILTGTREGQVLFRKVIQILESGESDPDWTALLATILKNISDEKIATQFRQYEFLLSQIDKLSPQSLVVLSKYNIWKDALISGTTTTSKKKRRDRTKEGRGTGAAPATAERSGGQQAGAE